MTKSKRVLIVTDLQRDFLPGGAIGIGGANFIVASINRLMDQFDHIVLVRDWHPKGHVSFASTHGKRKGETIQVGDAEQILWPDHCVQETKGAGWADELRKEKIEAVFDKGVDVDVDSYSAFFDSKKRPATELASFLKKHQLKDLYFVGVATDYCILHSVLDALELGFHSTVILDLCRSINRHLGDEQRAIDAMKKKGAKIVNSDKLKFS